MVINYKNSQRGQVLLLSVMVLSSIIISVSFFVGYLMIQRLKQSVLSVDSAQAFYLSDSGVELELYRFTKGDSGRTCDSDFTGSNKLPNNTYIRTSIIINGDKDTDPALGWEIHSTGCVGKDCQVSRSQIDTSQTLIQSSCSNSDLWFCDNPQAKAACKT